MSIMDVLNNLKAGKLDPKYAQLLMEEELSNTKFSKKSTMLSFNFDEPYVKDHTVNGERILLGVTYVGLALKLLMNEIGGSRNIQLKNVIFKVPVVLHPGITVQVYANLSDSTKEINIYTLIDGEKKDIACVDVVAMEEHQTSEKIDLDLMKSRAITELHSNSIYGLDDKLGIEHGSSLKTLDELIILNDQECFGKLSLKLDDKERMGWPIHPAFIEAASMSWIHLIPSDKIKSFIPISIKSVQVTGLLSSIAYSHVKLVKMKNDLVELEIDIYDEYGTLAVRIKGFVLKYFNGKKQIEEKKLKLDEDNLELKDLSISETAKQSSVNRKMDNKIREYIIDKLRNICNLPGNVVNLKKNFMEIGLNSVQLLELAKQIEKEIKIELYPTLFFEYQNIKELSMYFKENFEEDFMRYFEVDDVLRNAIENTVQQNIEPETANDVRSRGFSLNEDNLGLKDLSISETSKQSLVNSNIDKKIREYIIDKLRNICNLHGNVMNLKKNFMEIGLNSIQLLELAKQIEKEIKIELYPTLFFEYQNIKELSMYFKENFKENFMRYFELDGVHRNSNENTVQKNINSETVHDAKIKDISDELSLEESEDIAIIGMKGILPESENFEEFWNNMLEKKDLIKEIPLDHFDYKNWYDERFQRPGKFYCKSGSFIDNIAKFDAEFFGVSEAEAEVMDPQLRKLLEVNYGMFEDAGYIDKVRGSNTGYYVGACFHDYLYELIKSSKRVGPYDGLGNATTMLANYPSFYFDLNGPSLAVDTACSSSLVALHLACNAIKNKECDMAVVAGVNLLLSPWHYLYFCSTGVLSKSGRCHTFDSRADGYVPGEAIVSLLLKPLNKAKQDGDHIHAIIKGSAINHGGHASAITAPNVRKEADVIYNAWRQSKVDPNRINFIEAHGTGTQLGDPIEVSSIKLAFDKLNRGKDKCVIGSVKASIGHTEGAAGLTGIVRAILAMKHKTIPAMPRYETLNPIINLKDTPLIINTEPMEWKKIDGLPRVAGISSFGFGGTYSHVVLEEYIEFEQKQVQQTHPELLTLSAKTKTALFKKAKSLCSYLNKNMNNEEIDLGNICYTLNKGRQDHNERLAIIAENIHDLLFKLSEFVEEKNNIQEIWINHAKETDEQLLDGNVNLNTLAELWSSGYSINWEKYYDREAHHFISLPTYPFEGKDYWVRELQSKSQIMQNDTVKKTPNTLIDGKFIEKGEVLEFRIELEGTEFYLAEHKVHGKKVLVGAAFIEASAKVMDTLWPNKNIQFKNIQWLRPVIVEQGKRCILLTVNKRKNLIQIQSESSDGMVIYFKTEFSINSKQEPTEQLPDENQLKKICHNKISKKQLYAEFKSLGLDLGESFQMVDEIYYNGEYALAYINTVLSVHDHSYQMHPALLDGAFHTVSAFFREEKEYINVPFSIGEIQVYGRLEGPMIAYAEYSKKNKAGSRFGVFDFIICTAGNKILAIIHNFAAQKILPQNLATSVVQKKQAGDIIENIDGKVSNNNSTCFLGSYWEQSNPLGLRQNTWKGGTIAFVEEEHFGERLLDRIGIEQELRVIVTKGEHFRKVKQGYYQLNPTKKEDYIALWKDIGRETACFESIIHFWSQETFIPDDNIVLRQFNNGPLSYFLICQTISQIRLKSELCIYYLYSYGESGVEPIYEALPSMAKSIAKENMKLRTKSIGCRRGSSVDEIYNIVEMEQGEKNHEVLYKAKQRFIRSFIPIDTESTQPAQGMLINRGVVIITGGFGAIGLIIGQYLAKKYKARVVLTGRRTVKNQNRYKELFMQLGGDCLCLSGDICKTEDVKNIISTTKLHFGELNGIINCAGIINDKSFMFKTLEDIKVVLAPKVYGTVLLDSATENEALDFFVTISSVSAVIGNQGQSDYAYANGFMDWFCSWRNEQRQQGHRKGRALSINYPLWEDGGMKVAPEIVEDYIEKLGIMPILQETGLAALEYGLKNSFNQICVVKGDRNKIDRYWSNIHWDEKEICSQITNKSKEVDKMVEKLLKEELVQILARLVQQTNLNIQGDTTIEQCGMDSIGYSEFANQINEKFNIDISPAIFFSNPSINMLVTQLIEEDATVFNNIYSVEGKKSKLHFDPIYDMKSDKPSNHESKRISRNIDVNEQDLMQNQDVAIIGMDGIFPGSPNLESLWSNLQEGKDLIKEIPKERWNWKEYCEKYDLESKNTALKWGGFIEDVDAFDHKFFNITPHEAEQMDPQQRLFMMIVWKAIEDSGHSPYEFSGKKVGVFVGASSYDYMDLIRQNGNKIQAYTSIGNAHSIISNRVSYFLNLHGPSETIDTACSSSLVAVTHAVELLKSGECEYAIAGGINLMLSPTLHQSFNKAGMLSADGRCKTFDKNADGYVRGEGGGAVVLKRLDKAIKDKDNIYAVIKGCAINHGGRATSLTAPNPEAQAELLISCYEKSNIDFSTIQYIEAHGTGTELGDVIEIEGLKKAYNVLSSKQNKAENQISKCAIGSIKTNIGHLEAASGIASLIKSILMLKKGKIPPHLQVSEINPKLKLENSHYYIQKELMNWEPQQNDLGVYQPRRAGVSSFGFGGTNAHIILEEYYESMSADSENKDLGSKIYTFSAMSEQSLHEYMKNFLAFLDNERNTYSLDEIAYNLQCVRASMGIRVAIIATNKKELKDRVKQVILKGVFTKKEGIYPGDNDKNDKLHDLLSGDAGDEFVKYLLKSADVDKIALIWSSGINICWEYMYKEVLPRHISLPTYVFSKDRHWVSVEQLNGQVIKDKELQLHDVSEASETVTNENHIKDRVEIRQIKNDLKKWILDITKTDMEGLDENTEFSLIGLDSVLYMELLRKIKNKYGIRVFPNELLMNPTISKLAILVYEGISSEVYTPKESISSANKELMGTNDQSCHKVFSGKKEDKRIVYIFSSPRSGSTLLRTMLMGHSEIFAPPELMLLPYDNMKEWDANLKERNWVHFKDGLIETIKVLKNLTPNEALKETQDMIDQEYTIKDIYRLLQNLSPERYFIDKTPPYSESVDILKRAEHVTPNALYIYLHRHPLSVMESLVRNRFHKLLGIKEEPWEFADNAWRESNQNIVDFLKTVPSERKKEVAYEDLVTNSEDIMNDLCGWLGINYEKSMINPYEGNRMITGLRESSMSVGDPNFLNHKAIEPELANSWKKNLGYKDMLSKNTLQLAESLGYSIETELEDHIQSQKYKSFGLGPAQEGFLRYVKLFDQSLQFTMIQSINLTLMEMLKHDKMNKSLADVIKAHPVLTNRFFEDSNVWYQQPTQVEFQPIQYLDGSEWQDNEWEDKRNEAIKQMLLLINPRKGELINLIIIDCGNLTYEFILIIHHLVCDAVSSNIIWKELLDRYYEKSSSNNAVEIGFREYVCSIDQLMETDSYKKAEDYWKLETAVDITESIPVDFSESIEQNIVSNENEVKVFVDFNDIGTTLNKGNIFHILSTALYLTIGDWMGSQDVCIAHMLQQRNLPINANFENTIGCFVEDIPILIKVGSGRKYADIMNEFKRKFSKSSSIATSYEILANQGKLPKVRDLCEVRLNYQPYRLNTLEVNNWSTSLYIAPNSKRKYLLNCIVQEQSNGIRFVIRYSVKHHKKQSVDNFVQRWVSQVKEICLSLNK